MEIIEAIKYFAKFPDKAGVLENFKRTASGFDGYTELRNYINSLPDPLMPEIKDFVVGMNEEDVAKRIRSIDNYFIFLEYGPITATAPDRVRLRSVSFNLAINVCYHWNGRNIDSMEEAIIMDTCLAKAFAIAKQMIEDDALPCAETRYAEASINLAPIEPAFLYQSIGWSLSFKKTNKTML